MDTLKGWFGYGRGSVTETVIPDSSIETDTPVNEKSINDNTLSEQTFKPVLDVGETPSETLFQKFDLWTRSKIPLEPEDKLDSKLATTFIISSYLFCMYLILVSPKATGHMPLRQRKVFKTGTRVIMTLVYASFLHAEWYVPLYKKYDKEGRPNPRTYLGKLSHDWKYMTSFVTGKTPDD